MNPKDTKVYFTDREIQQLIKEKKVAASRKDIVDHKSLYGVLKGSTIELQGEHGNKFELRSRKISNSGDNFSVILSVYIKETNETFRLRRYNGYHPHKNKIEGDQLEPGCHIHSATERYQRSKYRKHDGFAELTDRYDTIYTALRCVAEDCNIVFENDNENQPKFI